MNTSFAALTAVLALLSVQPIIGGHILSVPLSGGNEVPAVSSSVTGTATIELLSDGTIEFDVSLLNPSGVALLGEAGAHIHCGAIDSTGPAVAFLAQPEVGGLLTSSVDFSAVLDDTSIFDGACGSTIALLYESIRAGGVYINVHSTENPGGEVRGQTPQATPKKDAITVLLSGDNQVPVVTTSVTGAAEMQLLSDGSIKFEVNLLNPSGVALLGEAGAHIHCGAIDSTGPVVAFLAQPEVGGLLTSPVGFSRVLDLYSIVDGACGSTIALLYESIKAGGTYINVHSTENPGGEVRGQILVTTMAATPAPTMVRTGAPTMAPTSASPHFKLHSAFGLIVAFAALAAM